MRVLFLNRILGSFTLLQVALIVLPTVHVVAASPIAFAQTLNPALVDAKRQAESKGFVFYTSRAEIIAKARQEGRLSALGQFAYSSSLITKALDYIFHLIK